MCDSALGECGVRYCAGGFWCTILPWGVCGVRYCTGGEVVYDTTPHPCGLRVRSFLFEMNNDKLVHRLVPLSREVSLDAAI